MTVAIAAGPAVLFLWVFCPTTVRIHREAYDPRSASADRTWAALAIAGHAEVPVVSFFPKVCRPTGITYAATAHDDAGIVGTIRSRLSDATVHLLVSDRSKRQLIRRSNTR